MGVSFGTSGITENTASVTTTGNISFNIGTLTNGALVIWLFVGQTTGLGTPTCTYAGVSMLNISGTSPVNSGTGCLTLFGLVNPANGANNANASWTGAGDFIFGFWSFSGADQTANSTTFINGTNVSSVSNNTTATQSVTTVSGNATVFGWATGGVLTPASCTPALDQHDNMQSTIGVDGGMQHTLSTTTSDSYTFVQGTSDAYEGCGCSIKASAGGDVLMAQVLT